jgi:aryl-alcohol dehydrogenase-like predicted oxidoreductase
MFLPYARDHKIGVLGYRPLAHGLLPCALDEHTTFQPGDWRGGNPSFSGETYHHNLETVAELQHFAEQELDSSVAQLAVAWTLANPAVNVTIVGALCPTHIEEAVAATELRLGRHELERTTDHNPHRPVIAVLGLGPMGTPIAYNLLAAGLPM